MNKHSHEDGGFKSRKLFLAVLFGFFLMAAAFKAPSAAMGELSFGLGFLYASYCGANGAVKIMAARKGIVPPPSPPTKKKTEADEPEEAQEGA